VIRSDMANAKAIKDSGASRIRGYNSLICSLRHLIGSPGSKVQKQYQVSWPAGPSTVTPRSRSNPSPRS
jgi:hypothetical protein